MNIIFGKEQADTLADKHTVLELDTFRFVPGNVVSTAYAVIEHIAIPDMPKLEQNRGLHGDLMENYRKAYWNFCEQAIEQLIGCWSSELDTFYSELQSRINAIKEKDSDEPWNPIIDKLVG